MAEEKVSPATGEESSSLIYSYINEVITSPVNLFLTLIIVVLVYKIFKSKTKSEDYSGVQYKELPKIRRDFTLEELKPYNGEGPDGRILMAVNGNVYDVTKGARFYGPGGPYAAFGGRDASRGLATFSVVPGKDDYDDLSDLNTDEMNSVKEWEEQFKERYEYVGKLLRPGEPHSSYSDEEEEGSTVDSDSKSKSE